MKDVLEGINRKLIRRHPHIYGDVVAKDAEAVKNNWEKIKLTEGRKSVLSGVPQGLPAIVKAYRIQEKARGIGFDWEEPHQVWDKVIEEMNELQDEVKSQEDKSKIESEFGDLLFALVNYARFIGINPEDALERTNKKFISRFQYLEEKSKEDGKSMQDMTLGEMDVYWNEAKDIENGCSQCNVARNAYLGTPTQPELIAWSHWQAPGPFYTDSGSKATSFALKETYWQETSPAIVSSVLSDYYDDGGSLPFDTTTSPYVEGTSDLSALWPFVKNVSYEDSQGNAVTAASSGIFKLIIDFNRAMMISRCAMPMSSLTIGWKVVASRVISWTANGTFSPLLI